jgi:uncharacterized protein YabE (DUF348 family)
VQAVARPAPRLSPAFADSLIILAAFALLIALWVFVARPVSITVDGYTDSVRTRRATVGVLLSDLGLTLTPLDRVTPVPDTRVTANTRITIERARPLRLFVDGRDISASSWGATLRDAFSDAGIAVDLYDRAQVNGVEYALDTPLPPPTVAMADSTYDRGYAWAGLHVEPLQILLRRAIPMVVDEGGAPYTLRTTAPTVGEALRQAQVTLYLGDRVNPSLGSSVSAGLRVLIERSTPISVQADGVRHKTRVQARNVADALADLGLVAAGLDRVEPPLDTTLYPNIDIRITRVTENIEVTEEIEPFETVFVGDPNIPIDTQQTLEPGAEGITRQRYRVTYEDGEPVARVLEDDWIAQPPATRRIAYGQQITPQTAVVEGQSITYWRKIKMLATSYTAASAGGNRTRTGDLLRPGIVAVDPALIPLRSQVFVPGYGIGDALDTGGGIRSRRIDLSYDEATFKSVLRWVDVYLLWPPPAASQITWVVPNYPKPPGS